MANLYNDNSDIHSNQSIYDSFNDFIFSKDRNVFNKMIARSAFYAETEHLHGDIVECGVFKGSGLLTWLKLLDLNEPHSIKKVLGLDFFGNDFVKDLHGIDKETMKQVFDRDAKLKKEDVSMEGVRKRISNAGFDSSKFELIQGDVSKTSEDISVNRPGLRISILYLDMDLDEPTYAAVCNLWDNVVSGGYIVFDEYAYHSWSESNAVDRICKDFKVKLHKTKIKAPTAYIIKP